MAKESPEAKEKTPAVETTAASTQRTKSKAEHLFRFSTVDADSADDDAKTIQVCFSSEELVLRKATEYDEHLGIANKGTKYWELLSHRKGDCDFSELDGGKGTVLDEHENSLQLGKVPRANRSKDSVGRAVLKFDGLSELSTTRYEQMKRGERTGISTGYWHTKFIADEGEQGGYPIKRMAWAADEISSVRNAADKNRAGVRRSAEGQWACLQCGDMFDRAKLDENFECGCEADIRAKRSAIEGRKSRKSDNFKFQRDEADEISFSDLKGTVGMAVDSDKRFKSKRPNGDLVSAFFVDDIIYDHDEDSWSAIIFNWYDGTFFEVEFKLEDDDTVTLGEAAAGTYEQNFIPLDASARASVRPTAKRTAVDSAKSVIAENTARSTQIESTKNFMAKTIAELKTEAPELVTEIESTTRTATEKTTRAAVTAENEARSKKREPLVKEIRALADAFVKDHGRNWAGKPGEVVVVGERIRAFEQEACNAPTDHSDSEIRTDFKNKANELIRSSRAPKNQEEAANLPQELAGRCSFMRAVQSAIENCKGVRTTALMPGDGAELEAHQEITRKLPSYPGGTRILEQGGFFLPPNMPAPVMTRSAGIRQTRDALAMDFATAGATIQPDFRPMIELLRNELVCTRLGATFLGGLIGDVIFPRQEAATVAQSLAEGAQLAPYDQVLGQIRMSPHRVGSRQFYSRLAVLQSSLDFEAFVLNDHMQVIALYLDYLALNGTGAADQPLGVLNQPGINQVIFAGTPTFAQLISFRTLIRQWNINGPIGFVTSSVAQGRLAVLPAGLVGATLVSGINGALWIGDEANGSLIGATAIASQQIPNNTLLAGVWANLLVASWGGINVVIDNLTRADRDEIAITTNTYMDAAVRHAQAFTRSGDSANQ